MKRRQRRRRQPPTASSRSRRKSPGHVTRGERGFRQGRQDLDPGRTGKECARHRLGSAARCRAAGRVKFGPIMRFDSALAALVGSEPLDAWKDWLAFPRSTSRRPCCPRQSATQPPSTARRLAAPPSSGRAGAGAQLGRQQSSGRGRKAYVAKYFPPKARPKSRACRQDQVRLRNAVRHWTGWRRQPSGGAEEVETSSSVSAIRTAGVTIRR